MTRIIFLRHGQSEENAGKVRDLGGPAKYDPILTEKGRMQAEKTGEFLRHYYNIAAIKSSSMARARETTDIVAAKLAEYPAIKISDDLIEASDGNDTDEHCNALRKQRNKFDLVEKTKHTPEYENIREQLYAANVARESYHESDGELVERIKHITKDIKYMLKGLKDNEDLLVVSHDSMIRYIIEALFGIDANGLGSNFAIDWENRTQITNCYITTVNCQRAVSSNGQIPVVGHKEKWRMELMFYTKHLA